MCEELIRLGRENTAPFSNSIGVDNFRVEQEQIDVLPRRAFTDQDSKFLHAEFPATQTALRQRVSSRWQTVDMSRVNATHGPFT